MRLQYYIFAVAITVFSTAAFSQEEIKQPTKKSIYVQAGSYIHFSISENHKGKPLFISAEVQQSNHWLYGLGLFNNSFDQFSQYLYGGYIFDFNQRWKYFHAKITMGIIHGYKDEFQDNLPYNVNGYAPVIISGIGWKKDKLGFDMTLLGKAGILFTIGYDFASF